MNPEQYKEKSSDHRSIAHTNEFREFIRNNPGILSRVRDLLEKKPQDASSIEDRDISIKQIGNMMDRYEVDTGDQKFFLKKVDFPSYNRGDGFVEIKTSHEVEDRVKDLPWVKVVNYLFGYTHGRESYFVSKWDDKLKITLFDYLRDLKKEQTENPNDVRIKEEMDDLNNKVRILKERFADLKDFDTHNMIFDRENGSMILFDLLPK